MNLKIEKGSVKLQGPFKTQSYITHMSPAKLVVACTIKQSPSHFQILKQVLQFISKTPNCSKQQAVEERNQLLKNA
jgi:hypothetical protein